MVQGTMKIIDRNSARQRFSLKHFALKRLKAVEITKSEHAMTPMTRMRCVASCILDMVPGIKAFTPSGQHLKMSMGKNREDLSMNCWFEGSSTSMLKATCLA